MPRCREGGGRVEKGIVCTKCMFFFFFLFTVQSSKCLVYQSNKEPENNSRK